MVACVPPTAELFFLRNLQISGITSFIHGLDLLKSTGPVSCSTHCSSGALLMRKVFLCTAAGALALAVACGKSSEAPTSPSTSATAGDTSAAADGSTLK